MFVNVFDYEPEVERLAHAELNAMGAGTPLAIIFRAGGHFTGVLSPRSLPEHTRVLILSRVADGGCEAFCLDEIWVSSSWKEIRREMEDRAAALVAFAAECIKQVN